MNNNENTVKFSDLAYIFVSKLWLMILVAVIVSGSIFVYNIVSYEPLYKSTGSIYILRQDSENENINYNQDFNLALDVVTDCTNLLTSRSVLNEVIKANNLDYTYTQLCEMITIENPSNTRFLEISASTGDPKTSKAVVDSICEIGKEQSISIMGFNQLNIVDEGTLPEEPYNSKYSITIILAFIAAFILTYIILVMVFIFDDKISDPEYIEKQLELSVLGVIPVIGKDKLNTTAVLPYQKKETTKRHRYYTQSKGDK